jgi:hypothetical protein
MYSSTFRPLHASAATEPRHHSDSKQTAKDFVIYYFSQHEKAQFNIQSIKHKSNTDETLPSQSPRRTKRYERKPENQRSQQNKNNMANHRSLKSTLLQAETQENSEKQASTHSCSQKKRQRNSQSKTFSQHGKSDFNIRKLKRRFNTRTPKNLKEQLTVHSKRQNPDAYRKKQLNFDPN